MWPRSCWCTGAAEVRSTGCQEGLRWQSHRGPWGGVWVPSKGWCAASKGPVSGCGGWDMHGKGKEEPRVSCPIGNLIFVLITSSSGASGGDGAARLPPRCSASPLLEKNNHSKTSYGTSDPLCGWISKLISHSEQQGKKLKCCGSSLMQGGFSLSRCWGREVSPRVGFCSGPGEGQEGPHRQGWALLVWLNLVFSFLLVSKY